MALTLENLTSIANNYTDENFSSSVVADFYNEAIARINTSLSVYLPYIDKSISGFATVPLTALDETWLRNVVVPYICYSIKINDGSMNEASTAFMQRFEQGLRALKPTKRTSIDINYRVAWQETDASSYINADVQETVYTGTSLPSSSFLSTVAKDLQKVVKVSNGTEETPLAYPSVKYFKLVENSNKISIKNLGPHNIGWF